ncbi:hypothetical protein AMECASPLE_033881 [Ameca splendens]|uniref:Uncharacterized protein n=1 Tax=Ameca splendens TaxID=208324 RepID=A0ABV0YUV6_9TELE
MAHFFLVSALGKWKPIKNSCTSPAMRRRGSPASSPAPAATSPNLVSPAVSPFIFILQTDHPTFSLLHSSRSWILSSAPRHPLLTCSVSSPPSLLRQHFLFPAPSSLPTPRPLPLAFALGSARPSSSLGEMYHSTLSSLSFSFMWSSSVRCFPPLFSFRLIIYSHVFYHLVQTQL